jgi:hypothetical protein
MDSEMLHAMAVLTAEGVRVDLEQRNMRSDVFVAELPNGDKYEFLGAGLLKLQNEGKLSVAGITEAGIKRKAVYSQRTSNPRIGRF